MRRTPTLQFGYNYLSMITLADIQAAAQRIAGAICRTPCQYSFQLSRLCGCNIYCKLEHLQVTSSFKERGACNKLMQLTAEERQRGVIAASAGNHALALAYHGQKLGISVTVVMPRSAPIVKLANCRSFGAQVILEGQDLSESLAIAKEISRRDQRTFITGYDDDQIIAGAGTAGLEIFADVPNLDAVIVPVGGGGLLAGVGTAIKALKPAVRVIGVEPVRAPTLNESLKAGKVTRIATRQTLADGLAVAEIGASCFELIRKTMDELVMVDEAQISLAIMRLLELEKMVVEGAGAVSLAAAMQRDLKLAGKNVVLCLSGGNIDVTVISRVIERGLAADGRLCRMKLFISDRPGSLAQLLAIIADAGGSIKELSHDRNFGPADVLQVPVSVVMETRDAGHIEQIRAALVDRGYELR